MHSYDEERLQHICGSHELPERLLQLYGIAQKLWHTIQTGPMSDDVLMCLVIQAKAYSIPEAVENLWDNVPAYTDVVVRHRSETPYEAEFVRRTFGSDGRDIGQVEIRLFRDDTTLRSVPQEYVSILEPPSSSIVQSTLFDGLKSGDLVAWTNSTEDGPTPFVRFQGVMDDGKIHLKTGRTNSKNTYVPASEVSLIPVPEAV